MENLPIRSAVAHMGGIAAAARSLGISGPAVHQWTTGARRVPAEHCPAIERATNGAVRCEDLRPDIEWGVLRQSGAGDEKAA